MLVAKEGPFKDRAAMRAAILRVIGSFDQAAIDKACAQFVSRAKECVRLGGKFLEAAGRFKPSIDLDNVGGDDDLDSVHSGDSNSSIETAYGFDSDEDVEMNDDEED